VSREIGERFMAVIGANDQTSDITRTLMDKYNHREHVSEKKNNELGKDGFLKLLLTELKYQDPTSPMDTDKMVNQEAQMSQLEQSINVSKSLDKLAAFMNKSGRDSAVSYLGREVEIPSVDEPGEYISGIIDEVKFRDGTPIFVVDGREVTQADIISVRLPQSAN
jgi:flagellar basal-body rod modification protein FlgD